jgi:hypothetical protein
VLVSGVPGYGFAHFSVGDQGPMPFGRLLLPLGRGGRTTHLILAAMFTGTEQEPD